MKPGILSSTFHFPEIMLNIITSGLIILPAMCGVSPINVDLK